MTTDALPKQQAEALTIQVPFVQVGNRRALTMQQLAESPALADFVDRFRHRFEHDLHVDILLFIERETADGD